MNYLHESHNGMVRMKSEARGHVWWPGMDALIEQTCHRCRECNLFAKDLPSKKHLFNWPKESEPWSRIHLDFAGPFYGQMFLLVIDAFSKWPEIVPMSSITTERTVEALKNLLCKYGIPRTIVSDNGTSFTSQGFKDFCLRNNIKHITTPVAHPSSNGQVEKNVDTFKRAMNKLQYNKEPSLFTDNLRTYLFRYRATPHTATGQTPASLFLGRNLRTKLDFIKPSQEINSRDEPSEVLRYKKTRGFSIGSKVYIRTFVEGKVKWKIGTILRQLGRNTWLIDSNGHTKRHTSQMRKFYQDNESEEEDDPCIKQLPQLLSSSDFQVRNAEVHVRNSENHGSPAVFPSPSTFPTVASQHPNSTPQLRPRTSPAEALPHPNVPPQLRRSTRTFRPQRRLIEEA
ncbi:uncharacterized protein K02A2.6-like [Macrosteles quadrilineatus]|uniref:uncharacterized protein K02A2.6-like n=1 Tax=Macrosteles quadrilineatus TaxID=74068 RepID=UPI0023E1D42B|nr:uncharacterized protein K02A2.6-like [Macrosteles quadrilineatus]